MAFFLLLATLLLLLLLQLPQIWIKKIIASSNDEDPRIQGNGLQFITHLRKAFNLEHLKVEVSKVESYYNPNLKTIFLAENIAHKNSVASITIAAHEFGHAYQHHLNMAMFSLRSKLVYFNIALKIISIILAAGCFIIAIFSKNRIILLLGFASAVVPGISYFLSSLISLPLEWDASFNRALPILQKNNYIPDDQMPKAKRILTASFLSYMAAAIADLVNIFRFRRPFTK